MQAKCSIICMGHKTTSFHVITKVMEMMHLIAAVLMQAKILLFNAYELN
jgi:hypothetical protein